MRTRLLPLAAVLALAAAACPARADTPPSVWDKARDPSVSEHWALHLRVQHLLSAPHDEESDARLSWKRDAELHAEAALAMLEDAGAATSPDVQVRFDLGMVLYELAHSSERTDLYEKAARTLEGALALGPDAPGSTEALDELAACYGRLDRSRDELETWRRLITRVLDPRSRALDSYNMAEAEMRLGRVDDALATLREVLHACGELPNTSSTYVLTLWDVAVALDRSGDPRGALATAAQAARQSAVGSGGFLTTGRGLLKHDEGVYFVPAYERDWYLALGSEALAKQDTDPREAAAYLAESLQEWDEYITQATAAGVGASAPAGPRQPDDASRTAAVAFLRIAHLRRDRVQAALTAAGKHLKGVRLRPLPEAE
jgi:tetratricopeptide (TPR) repeat protein